MFVVKKSTKTKRFYISHDKEVKDYAYKEQAEFVLKLLEDYLKDIEGGKCWHPGKPKEPGTYLIEINGKMTIARVFENGGIDALNNHETDKIKRHMLLS